jgi:molybdenum cofactor guanylyltransferase
MNLERQHVSDVYHFDAADDLTDDQCGRPHLEHLTPGPMMSLAPIPTVVAAILVGGRSQRMGSDKALLVVGGETLLDRTVVVLRSAGIGDITVLGGPEQWAHHRGLVWRADSVTYGGPAAAIAEFLDDLAVRRPDSLAIVVACDLACIDTSVLNSLIVAATSAGPSRLTVAVTDRVHPTASCWPASCAGELRAHVATGQRRLVELVAALGAHHVPIEPPELMVNINTPNDLAALDGPRAAD